MEKTNYWFEVDASIDTMKDDGNVAPIKVKSLVDAFSFKEAEERIIEELAPYSHGNFDVLAVKRVKIAELYDGESQDDKWFKIKVLIITLDEKTMAEKETPKFIVVQSSSCESALNRFKKEWQGVMADYRVVKVEETTIENVFKFKQAAS